MTLGILDLTTMEITRVTLPAPDGYLSPIVSWSADNKWAMLSFSPDETIIVNLVTGAFTQLYAPAEADSPYIISWSALWLSDNRVLVHADKHANATVASARVNIDDETTLFDPISGDKSPIEITSWLLRSTDVNQMDRELQNYGLALAVPRFSPLANTAYFPDMAAAAIIDIPDQLTGFGLIPCSSWILRYAPLKEASFPRQFYSTDAAALLSDPYLLPDGSLLVAQWKAKTCDPLPQGTTTTGFRARTLTIELLHINPDGKATVVAPDVFYGWVFDIEAIPYANSLMPFYPRSNLFTVSPDGRYVAWVTNGDTTDSIRVTDLVTLQSASLVAVNHREPEHTMDPSILGVALLRTRE